jgi:hypothetical protein
MELKQCAKCGAKGMPIYHPKMKLYLIYCSDNCEKIWKDRESIIKQWNLRKRNKKNDMR